MVFRLHKNLFAAAIAATMGLYAPPDLMAQPLTEGDSLRTGLARQELGEVGSGRIGEAEAEALGAGLWPNPVLEYSRDHSRSGTAAQEETWQLLQPFDFSGRRGLKQDASKQRVAAAEADVRQLRAGRAVEIRRSFFQLLLHEQQLAALDAWVSRFGEAKQVVSKLRAAGEASGYDLRRLTLELQAAEARQAEKHAELARIREEFIALLGIEASVYTGVTGQLLPEAPASLEALLGKLDARPDLMALGARAMAADLEERAAARGWIPEVTLGIGSKRSGSGTGYEKAALFSASIPLPAFDRQQPGQKRAAAQALAARAEYRLIHSQAKGQLRGLRGKVMQLIAAAETYRREATGQSGDLVRIAGSAYRAGESTILELLDAYKGALEAELTALDLEWKAREASIELEQLTGSHPL